MPHKQTAKTPSDEQGMRSADIGERLDGAKRGREDADQPPTHGAGEE